MHAHGVFEPELTDLGYEVSVAPVRADVAPADPDKGDEYSPEEHDLWYLETVAGVEGWCQPADMDVAAVKSRIAAASGGPL